MQQITYAKKQLVLKKKKKKKKSSNYPMSYAIHWTWIDVPYYVRDTQRSLQIISSKRDVH